MGDKIIEEEDAEDWHYDTRFDPYMLRVGRVAVVWAALEFAINQAIWQLANVEAGAGACITSQIIITGPNESVGCSR